MTNEITNAIRGTRQAEIMGLTMSPRPRLDTGHKKGRKPSSDECTNLWADPIFAGAEQFIGRWLPRGSELGLLANPASFEFDATVMEEDVNALFGKKIYAASVRLYGDAGTALPVKNWKVVPGGQNILPSAALGWAAGGEVPVATGDDSQGDRSAEPFFEVIGKLKPREGVVLLDGRSGKVSFRLAPEPLLPRWTRELWQLLQKRYQI